MSRRLSVRSYAAFTLLEVMIVVAIMALLAAICYPRFVAYLKTSQRNTCIANIHMLNRAAETYIIHNNLQDDAQVTLAMLAPETVTDIKESYFIQTSPYVLSMVHIVIIQSGGPGCARCAGMGITELTSPPTDSHICKFAFAKLGILQRKGEG